LLSTIELFWDADYKACAIEDGLRNLTSEVIQNPMHTAAAKTGASNYLLKAI